MAEASKDTIYIDAEDEITAIIEKVRASDAKIVALVLPKRASTLQSIVNLKLLKRTASDAKKSLVLITSEASLLPIAGAVGLHVAKSLQSKPEIPDAPKASSQTINVDGGADAPLDPHASIGQLAGHVATEETIDLDNDAKADLEASDKPTKKFAAKKFKIPDFDRFRLMLFGGAALLVLLIIGSVFAFVILPKAKIVIKTDTANINTDLNLTAKTDAKSVDAAAMVIPGISKSLKKTDTEKVPATGQRDDGTKAHGSATLALTDCSKDQVTIPAGTSLISGSLAFLTQAEIVLKSVKIGSQCKNSDFPDFSTATVNVSAQNAGDKYNLSARAYSVSGFTNVSASGSNMTGGTSKLTQVVSQSDVDNAKQKVSDRLSVAATTELRGQFTTDNALPLTDTFAAGTPTVASTPNVNEPGSDVSVSVTITFTELGVKQDDLKQIVEAEIKKHIDVSKQVIQDNGISKATILISDKTSPNQVKFNIKTLAIAGPELDADGIKKEVAGKKKGQTQTIIQSRPGIKDVTISYSPFWVYSTPKNTKHITVTFDQNNAGQ